jgi:glycosyltransferase involved in cell wall biosynthesis
MKTVPRLLHFQSTATFGGDESNSLLLCRELTEMEHHVAVYFGSGPMEEAWRSAGARVTLLSLSPRSRLGILAAVRRTCREVKPEAVFLSSVSLLPVVLKGLDGFSGRVLCHTGNPESNPLPTRLKLWLARSCLRPKADAVIVHCSDYVRRSFMRNSFYRRYRHEVAISAGLVALDGGSDGAPAARHIPRELSPDQQVRIGMLARLDKIKNHRLLLDAFGSILGSYPKARLEFIGAGAEREALERHAAGLGLGGKIVFHGRVPSAFPIVCQWDLFLYATTAAEGFGAALAEAMALGMPCLVTDIGPMREVGGEEGAVLYAGPDSAAEFALAAVKLLGDRSARTRMSQLARQRAGREFNSARFAARIRECLRLPPIGAPTFAP